MHLDNTTCVVTGSAGATGRAIVEYLLDKGANVVGIQSDRPHTNGLDPDTPGWSTLAVDVTNLSAMQEGFSNLLEAHTSLQVWINVVGGFQMGTSVEQTEPGDWNRMMTLNYTSTLNCCRLVLPHFKAQGRGRLINFGSAAAVLGMANASAYLVSKAAVHALTLSIAHEVSGDVTANAILPGIIDTPANRSAMPDTDRTEWVAPIRIARRIGKIVEGAENGELITMP